jgi:hypothetical protein
MGAEISSLIIQPIILGIATATLIFAEIKDKDEKLRKGLVGLAIGLIVLAVLISLIMAFLI